MVDFRKYTRPDPGPTGPYVGEPMPVPPPRPPSKLRKRLKWTVIFILAMGVTGALVGPIEDSGTPAKAKSEKASVCDVLKAEYQDAEVAKAGADVRAWSDRNSVYYLADRRMEVAAVKGDNAGCFGKYGSATWSW